MNGSVRGDEEGEFTYIKGRGETVIYYVVGGEEIRERIRRMERYIVGEKIDSDHQPIGLDKEEESR